MLCAALKCSSPTEQERLLWLVWPRLADQECWWIKWVNDAAF